jgi:hypothetical protein
MLQTHFIESDVIHVASEKPVFTCSEVYVIEKQSSMLQTFFLITL